MKKFQNNFFIIMIALLLGGGAMWGVWDYLHHLKWRFFNAKVLDFVANGQTESIPLKELTLFEWHTVKVIPPYYGSYLNMLGKYKLAGAEPIATEQNTWFAIFFNESTKVAYSFRMPIKYPNYGRQCNVVHTPSLLITSRNHGPTGRVCAKEAAIIE